MNYDGYGIKRDELWDRISDEEAERIEGFFYLNKKVGAPGWWSILSLTPDTTDLFIFDQIGRDGINSDLLITTLKGLQTQKINVRLNSTGGSYVEMKKIIAAMKNHPASFDTFISGFAGSAGSVLAIHGDTVFMAEDAFFQIHDAYRCDEQCLIMLDPEPANSWMAGIFSRKTGIPVDQIKLWMKQDTYFRASEAKELGFVDVIIPAEEWCASRAS